MNARQISILAIVVTCLVACEAEPGGAMVGTLERDRIELVAESNEPISGIYVADGQAVAPGDRVLDQDPARHAARLAQREAERDQMAARLAELVRGPREEQIREARALLAASEVQSVNAEQIYARARDIFERGLSDPQTLDNAQATRDTRRATVAANREALQILLNGATVEELQQAESTLEAAEAAVTQARLDLGRLTITVPVAGILDKVLFETGERPAPGTTVAVLLDNSRPYARIYVPQHLRAEVQPGASLEVEVDGFDEILRGTVSWVSMDASFTPYFALTEHDRSRLAYLAEVDLPSAADLPSGIPLEARLATP